MTRNSQDQFCTGCGIEITVGALVSEGKVYCCQDCLEGKPCTCGDRMEMEEPRSDQGIPPGLVPS